MKIFFKVSVIVILIGCSVVLLTPDKTMKVTTSELAECAEISPFAANVIVNTKMGRKVAYLFMKKKMGKYFKECRNKSKK
jgi:hypothetical protein